MEGADLQGTLIPLYIFYFYFKICLLERGDPSLHHSIFPDFFKMGFLGRFIHRLLSPLPSTGISIQTEVWNLMMSHRDA
jgi:hypothetical protein